MPNSDPRIGSAPRGSRLSVGAHREDDAYVVCVRGDLGMHECIDLEVALILAESSYERRIILDVDGLTSIDAAGLQVILEASRRSARSEGRLQMTRGRGPVAGLIRLIALEQTLPFVAADPGKSRAR